MELNVINANIGISTRSSVKSAEKVSARIIAEHDNDGDGRLNAQELGKRPRLYNKADTNGDSFVNREELFSALQKRLENRAGPGVQISLSVNVIKANLGSLLSGASGRREAITFDDLLSVNGVSGANSRLKSNSVERYISAAITSGISDNGLFGTSGGSSSLIGGNNSINPFNPNQNDNGQLLFDLLVGELNTPREEARTIINTLQQQTFETFG